MRLEFAPRLESAAIVEEAVKLAAHNQSVEAKGSETPAEADGLPVSVCVCVCVCV